MIKVILVAFFVFRGLTYAVERLSKADELDQVIRKDTLQISYMFLVIAVIGSLLSWSWHENLETVFHCVFLSLILSYAFFHFVSSIKHMNFMANTQAGLAERVGATRQTIIAIEAQKYAPSLELAFRIAHVLGEPVEEVFQFDSSLWD